MKRMVVVHLLLLAFVFSSEGWSQSEMPGTWFEKHEVSVRTEEGASVSIPYRLLKPLNVEAGRLYPILLFLHGAGERGSDNELQLRHLPERFAGKDYRARLDGYVIAPQCPAGERWVDVPWDAERDSALPQAPSIPMQGALDALDHVLASHPIDKDRVYLSGLSMGGYGTWDLLARYPNRWAGAAPICGGGDAASIHGAARTPIWAFHGADDSVVPVTRTRKMIAALRKAGGHPHYTEIENCGHNSWAEAYRNENSLLPWLYRQRRGRAEAVAPAAGQWFTHRVYGKGAAIKLSIRADSTHPLDLLVFSDQAGPQHELELTLPLAPGSTWVLSPRPTPLKVKVISRVKTQGELSIHRGTSPVTLEFAEGLQSEHRVTYR